MKLLYFIGCLFVLVGCILFLIMITKDRKNQIKLIKRKCENYAIVIPARYEVKVIDNILKSIKSQNNNMDNVYVIVEDKLDPSCQIIEKYKANIFIRKKPCTPRKGFALDECFKDIIKSKHYDLYFIFDADNRLHKNFIKEMIKSYNKGYDICIGYRNISNPVNVVSVCSGLTFSMINTLFNEQKNKNNKTIIISGTGYYISGQLIEKWNGFPFNTLTEDYELSLYATINNLSTYYNKKAVYFDEQPTKMSVSIKQRVRWIKGFLESRKKRLKNTKVSISKKMGIIPYLVTIIGGFLIMLSDIIEVFKLLLDGNINYLLFLISFLKTLIAIYVILMVFTFIILFKEEGKINISQKLMVKSVFYNPYFLFTYVICFLISLFKKEITWSKIEHTGQISSK